MLFSMSSFTTEAGRSTTSPAATWLATMSGSKRMRLMGSEVRVQQSEFRFKFVSYSRQLVAVATQLWWQPCRLLQSQATRLPLQRKEGKRSARPTTGLGEAVGFPVPETTTSSPTDAALVDLIEPNRSFTEA